MNDTEKACIHLRGSKEHPNSAMLIKVKSEIKTPDTPAFEGLTEIQRPPLCKEKQTEDPSSRQQPKTRKDCNGRPTSHTHAVSSKQANRKFSANKVQCHGCHKFGHFLKDCQTTSTADKKRI